MPNEQNEDIAIQNAINALQGAAMAHPTSTRFRNLAAAGQAWASVAKELRLGRSKTRVYSEVKIGGLQQILMTPGAVADIVLAMTPTDRMVVFNVLHTAIAVEGANQLEDEANADNADTDLDGIPDAEENETDDIMTGHDPDA